MNANALPELQQEVLDVATLERYESDLVQLAEILQVRVRSATAGRSAPGASLADSLRELRDGQASGVQIHYCYAGQAWLDTLLPAATGVRLIRICLAE